MSAAIWVAMLAGGAVGAPARLLLDTWVQGRTGARFPWGTTVVNATGSLLLGLLTGLVLHHGLDPRVRTVAGTGFCGAYTTFSTYAFESVRLAQEDARAAAANVLLQAVAGGALAGLGLALTLR